MTLKVKAFAPWRMALAAFASMLLVPALVAQAQTVDGVLTDTRTGRGIAEARVALYDTLGVEHDSTHTARDGQFTLQAGEEGAFLISVHRPGYADRISDLIQLGRGERVSYRMDLTPVSSDQVESIQSTLSSNARLRQVMVGTCSGLMDPVRAGMVLGVVRDRAGEEGIGGARVVLSVQGGDSLVAVTDRLGGYVFCAVPPGTGHPLRVTAEGWAAAVQDVDVLVRVISWYDFRLRPGGAGR